MELLSAPSDVGRSGLKYKNGKRRGIMTTTIDGDYEWDDAKATANAEKHGVIFSDAATALGDAKALDLPENRKHPENVFLFFSWRASSSGK